MLKKKSNSSFVDVTQSKKSISEYIEVADSIFGFSVKILLATGGLLALCYVHFFIHFFPSGISAGDSILFFFLAAAFAFVHILLIAVASYATVWVVRAIDFIQKRGKNKEKSENNFDEKKGKKWSDTLSVAFDYFFGLLFSVICMVMLFLIGLVDPKMALALAATGFVANALIIGLRRNPGHKDRLLILLLAPPVVAIIPFVMAHNIFEKELLRALEEIGIRRVGVDIALSKDNFEILQDYANQRRLPVFSCVESKDGVVSKIAVGADVLWHGPGSRSLISFARVSASSSGQPNADAAAGDLNQSRSSQLELDHDGVHIFGASEDGKKRCLSNGFKIFFEKGKSEISPDERGRKKIGSIPI